MIKFRSCIIIVKATLAATVIFWFGGVYHINYVLPLITVKSKCSGGMPGIPPQGYSGTQVPLSYDSAIF